MKDKKVIKREYYQVVPPSAFSILHAHTLEEAIQKKQEFGECPNGTPENKAYWKQCRDACKIYKVIEILEEVKGV